MSEIRKRLEKGHEVLARGVGELSAAIEQGSVTRRQLYELAKKFRGAAVGLEDIADKIPTKRGEKE